MFHFNSFSKSDKIVLSFDYGFNDIRKIESNIEFLKEKYNVSISRSKNVKKRNMSGGIDMIINNEYIIEFKEVKDLCNCLIEVGRILS